jgi:glycosyltransferase involved in cell wall biosynthesis
MVAARVLLLSNTGMIVGGGEVSLLQLLRDLDRGRWPVTVGCPEEGAVAARARSQGVPVLIVPMPTVRGSGLLRLPSLVTRLAGRIREGQFGLIHANGSRCMLYGGLAGRRAGVPVLWHVRIDSKDPWLDPLLERLADRIVANSAATAARFGGRAAGRVTVVPNGVDLAAFRPGLGGARVRGELGIPPEARLVGTVGRLHPVKGHDLFLRAAAEVATAFPTAHFLLVGGGEAEGELKALAAQLGLDPRVHFAGHREDIPEILPALDCFVLASREEPFGRVLVEAMAAGLPVVAARVGGVPEIVLEGTTGLLVPPGDPAPLAAAIRQILADPARARAMGLAGRTRAEREYDAALHARRVEALYADLVGSGGAGLPRA